MKYDLVKVIPDLFDSSFEQCSYDEVGTVYKKWDVEEYKCLIMRGNASLCAYIGVPEYSDKFGIIYQDLNADVHGGLTYCGFNKSDGFDPNYWYFGWDYAHYQDTCFGFTSQYRQTMWTPKMVYDEFPKAIESLRMIKPERYICDSEVGRFYLQQKIAGEYNA